MLQDEYRKTESRQNQKMKKKHSTLTPVFQQLSKRLEVADDCLSVSLLEKMSVRILTAILLSKASDGVMGILPPFLPNLRSRDCCTDSADKEANNVFRVTANDNSTKVRPV